MSIEAQAFKNIEIIYINDFSENDSKFFINIGYSSKFLGTNLLHKIY